MQRVSSLALASGLLFLAGTAPGFCAKFSISGDVAGPGASVLTSISLASGGEAVSAVQFDLVLDSASVITSKPAIHDHFKTGQRNLTQD